MINKVILAGYLVADPEVRQTKTGKTITSLRMAYNEANRDTLYINVDVWDKQGETCGRVLKKGSNIAVDGRLQVDNYENKDKVKVSKIFITADRVNFLPRFEKTNKEGSENEGQESPAPQKTSKSNPQDSSPVGADDDIPF
jgi:single-strand DNA-binding protein